MTSMEVREVILLLRVREQWCQGMEARRIGRHPCFYDDPRAVAWSLDGALFKVLGPGEALRAMPAFASHVLDRPLADYRFDREWIPAQFEALRQLKDYNDGPDAKYSIFTARLQTLPCNNSVGKAEYFNCKKHVMYNLDGTYRGLETMPC